MRLNTVLTVISLIAKAQSCKEKFLSQYRSHGYLFNQDYAEVKLVDRKSQYRSHGYLFNLLCTVVFGAMFSLNTVLTVISLITLISNNISHLFNFSSSCNPLTIICLTSIFPIFRKFTHFSLQTKRKQPYLY